MKHVLLLFSLSFAATNAPAYPYMKATAETVLTDLYRINGNYTCQKPAIEITKDEKNGAQFWRKSNTLKISQKAYSVCQSFGKDSLSALAFILGHELAHAYEAGTSITQTSFLAYDHRHGRAFLEESADVQGVFMAHLAGYRRAIEVMPEVIDRIYRAFDLKENIEGYPTLAERQQATRKAKEMAEELIHLFEAGNYLLAIGRYDLAVSCFEHIASWYKGYEIYNNLGIALACLALNFTALNTESYIFPLEINWHTRLQKAFAERGTEDLQAAEQIKKAQYLEQAKQHFLTASRMAPHYIAPDVNMMCVLTLAGTPLYAIEYYKKRGLDRKAQNIDARSTHRLNLALALALLHRKDHDKALKIWQSIKTLGGVEAFQAKYNLDRLSGVKSTSGSNAVCDIPSGIGGMVDNFKPHRPSTSGQWISLQAEGQEKVSILEYRNSTAYVFDKSGKYFALQRVRQPTEDSGLGLLNHTTLLTTSGSITTCGEVKLAFRVDANGRVEEWAKYY